jgi:hypothetical protein
MALLLVGKACPINVANSYQETFLPGAFDKFLASEKSKNVPMNLGHNDTVGKWSDLHFADDWLHCFGILDDADTEYKVRHRELTELSIAYHDTDNLAAMNAVKGDPDKEFAVSNSRLKRQIEAAQKVLKELSETDPLETLSILDDMQNLPREAALCLLATVAKAHIAPSFIRNVAIGEISLVKRGSFRNTEFHFTKI